jgi:hypothetical protein
MLRDAYLINLGLKKLWKIDKPHRTSTPKNSPESESDLSKHYSPHSLAALNLILIPSPVV